jgi:hypothetical protein
VTQFAPLPTDTSQLRAWFPASGGGRERTRVLCFPFPLEHKFCIDHYGNLTGDGAAKIFCRFFSGRNRLICI